MVTATPTKPRTINLPPLLPWQAEVESNPARFKVMAVGRRAGKTHKGIHKCVKSSLNQPRGMYWWVGPIYPISDIGWRLLKQLTGQMIAAGMPVKVREDPRFVEFPNGAQIWIKSADNPDSLRGEGLDGVVLDEFAQIKEETWTAVLRPALADKEGWAEFISTPKGKNWAFNLYNMAKVTPGWAAWQLPTTVNPFIPAEEIENARLSMSENEFKQEFEADFGASQFLVYPEFDTNIHKWKGPIPEFSKVVGGLDFGGTSIASHKSAGVVGIITAKDELIIIDEFEQAGPNIAERQMNWMWEAEARIRELSMRTKRAIDKITWHADKTQMVGIQLMRRNGGFNIFASKGGPDSVMEGIEMVHRRLKVREDGKPRLFYRDGLHFIPDAFERYRNADPQEDRPVNPKPLKINDDIIDATRYLIEGMDRLVIGDPAQLYRNTLPVLR